MRNLILGKFALEHLYYSTLMLVFFENLYLRAICQNLT